VNPPPSTTYLKACFSPQGIGIAAENAPSGCFSNGEASPDQLLKLPAMKTWDIQPDCHHGREEIDSICEAVEGRVIRE